MATSHVIFGVLIHESLEAGYKEVKESCCTCKCHS